ncbi:MAG: helix-turn-helix transcriptional regulator [Acidimicrobiales bacterium]
MSKAKLERLLNLTALLIETERPLTAQDIGQRMEGYPDDAVAFRQAFERDKRDLRDMGIPLVMETVPGSLPAVDGYRIPKDHYYLADPGLERDELAALHLAASVVRLDGSAAEEGLAKLGTFAVGAAAPAGSEELGVGIAALPARADLGAMFGAVVDRRPVRFRYRGEWRTLDPYRLDFQRGRWYLSGHDHARAASRIFRLDRIDGEVEVLDGPRFTRPTSDAPGGPVDPWRLGDGDPVMARLLVDGSHAPWVVDYLGPEALVEHRGDGGVVVELPVTNRDSFRSFTLTFLEHAEVLDPPELRDDLVAWLQKLVL